MTEPVFSVNVCVVALLAGTLYAIYWILTYDKSHDSNP